jgi:hypothetical protein
MLSVQSFYTLLLLSCLYAAVRGGAPERIGAAIYIVSAVLTTFALSAIPNRFYSLEVGALMVDTAMLVALAALALRADRFWPLWVTALQAIGTAAHAVKLADPTIHFVGYAFAMAFWSYPMLLVLVLGTWCHRRRLAREGADRPWSSSSSRSAATRTPPPDG